MEFCYYCGSIAKEQVDGRWICKTHKMLVDERKKTEESIERMEKESQKSAGEKVAEEEWLIFQINKEKQKGSKLFRFGNKLLIVPLPPEAKWISRHISDDEWNLIEKKFGRFPTAEAEQGKAVTYEKTKTSVADLERNLSMFTGTSRYYPHWSKAIKWTDGIQYLCDEAGAHWLMDIVASYQSKVDAPFQLWKLTVNPDNTAVITMQEDTGQPFLVRQEIQYTDFPLKEFAFYCIDRICLVKSEY